MRKMTLGSIAIKSFALVVLLGTTPHAMAQDATNRYPSMAPTGQYLMDRNAEIALARSAAPAAISHDASVMVLTRHGYEMAVRGKNGWVCMVGRAWGAMFDNPEFWNPKVRAAGCFNPPAARSVLPYDYKRAELILAGRSKIEVIAAMKAATDKRELPAVEPGAICYMMSKASYLTDSGDHNAPHLMFYQTGNDVAAWGANLTHSPIFAVNYWYMSPASYPQLKAFPAISVFLVGAGRWSDGTLAPPM
jgi:hypothetical protein